MHEVGRAADRPGARAGQRGRGADLVPGLFGPRVSKTVGELDRDGLIGFTPAQPAPIRGSDNADFLHTSDLKPLEPLAAR